MKCPSLGMFTEDYTFYNDALCMYTQMSMHITI